VIFFIDPVIVNDTSCNVNGFDHSRTYHRPLHYFPEDGSLSTAGNFSGLNSFTTIANPPSMVELTFPEVDATSISTSLIFRWKPSMLAEYYEIRVSSDFDFINILTDAVGITRTRFKINNLNPETDYYWSVKTNSQLGESSWSETRKFTTGTPEEEMTLIDRTPDAFRLVQNYFNLFNAETIISFGLLYESNVEIFVTDIQRQNKKLIPNTTLSPGLYDLPFSTNHLTSGVYFYSLAAIALNENEKQIKYMETKKMLVIK
jgi:hypothetical protein